MQKHALILATLFNLLLFQFTVNAQTALHEDIVYLKDGSIIHGFIIEQVPGKPIKIQTRLANVLVLNSTDIVKITKGELVSNSTNIPTNQNFIQSGFTNITEINRTYGMGYYTNENSICIQNTTSYFIKPKCSIGLGFGVEKYFISSFFPLFADFRYYFAHDRISPYFSIDAGYSFNYYQIAGYSFVNPSLGIKVFVSNNKCALNLSVGVKSQHYYDNFFYYYSQYYRNAESLNIKFGFSF